MSLHDFRVSLPSRTFGKFSRLGVLNTPYSIRILAFEMPVLRTLKFAAFINHDQSVCVSHKSSARSLALPSLYIHCACTIMSLVYQSTHMPSAYRKLLTTTYATSCRTWRCVLRRRWECIPQLHGTSVCLSRLLGSNTTESIQLTICFPINYRRTQTIPRRKILIVHKWYRDSVCQKPKTILTRYNNMNNYKRLGQN